jgi:D-alanine-D-alanine ligase
MQVGLTYDLKDDYLARGYDSETCAEFDSPETIDAIEAFLKSCGCKTERIGNIESLAQALVSGKRWDLVFNIAEGLHGRGREAQVPALLDAYQVPYVFSDPLVLSLTLDKALTKRVVRDAGIATAQFWVAESGSALPLSPPFPLFAKPVAEGTGKGITPQSLVKNEKELQQTVAHLHSHFGQPVLIEHYLPGREFTVGITGTGANARVIGVMEILLLNNADGCGYTYDNKKYYEERVRYKLVDDSEAVQAAEVALAAWNILQCRDGGRIDIRSDANHTPHFLEVNPLAGLHPVLGDLVILSKLAGVAYSDLLKRIFDSALSDSARFPDNKKPIVTAYA